MINRQLWRDWLVLAVEFSDFYSESNMGVCFTAKLIGSEIDVSSRGLGHYARTDSFKESYFRFL